MINNRQQNGRRRGRGGQRPQGGGGNPGRPDGGSRIDNRQRGNASQLYEKYKTLARDAQLSGDRVTTEYYLQFADHYFRVLSESRARFEDQQPQQRRPRDDQFDDEFDAGDVEELGAEGEPVRADEYQPQAQAAQQQQPRSDGERGDRGERQPRRERFNGHRDGNGEYRGDGRNGEARNGQPVAAPAPMEQPVADASVADEGTPAPRRRGRPPRARAEGDAPAEATVEADRLPPPLTVSVEGDGEDDAPRPRRRRARPAAEAEAGQAS